MLFTITLAVRFSSVLLPRALPCKCKVEKSVFTLLGEMEGERKREEGKGEMGKRGGVTGDRGEGERGKK